MFLGEGQGYAGHQGFRKRSPMPGLHRLFGCRASGLNQSDVVGPLPSEGQRVKVTRTTYTEGCKKWIKMCFKKKCFQESDLTLIWNIFIGLFMHRLIQFSSVKNKDKFCKYSHLTPHSGACFEFIWLWEATLFEVQLKCNTCRILPLIHTYTSHIMFTLHVYEQIFIFGRWKRWCVDICEPDATKAGVLNENNIFS